MNTTTENELLYVDEKAIKKEKSEMVKAQINLNKFIREAGNFLGDLTPEQMERIKKEKFKYIESEISKLFQHPKAKRDFNLQALGIEPKLFDGLNSYSRDNWYKYEFNLVNGEFILKDEQPALNEFYFYADTEGKRQALRIAREIIRISKDARNIGILRGDHLTGLIHPFSGILKVDGDVRKPSAELSINKEQIAFIVK